MPSVFFEHSYGPEYIASYDILGFMICAVTSSSDVPLTPFPYYFFLPCIEELILEAKTDCYGKDRLFVASFAFCVITFEPIMI